MGADEWDTLKHHLSRYTWPKLSILNLSGSIHYTRVQEKEPAKIDVDEIWNSYKIRILI
ncbi:uncharacterized protein MELLADRAFT_70571 [Melampsora larici-populina 98AG31]|uniref:Uncharacterized protein n=1 Tax=Melampsora larici-populina (strain 98AG31 / pathotype 3-4-7) TaxID=747676 RepID=F4R2Y5_MELLP|nr:uncharacterized protein MELLADRAFT_70571 [Melampsora larici-populina 98AG31]EGG12894.1 hypothetical protein MELLADRAFT_70571 [Melampsora larici-populina 98AG31]